MLRGLPTYNPGVFNDPSGLRFAKPSERYSSGSNWWRHARRGGCGCGSSGGLQTGWGTGGGGGSRAIYFNGNGNLVINLRAVGPYGGTWNRNTGYRDFNSHDEAFAAGVRYNYQHNSWSETYYASHEGTVVGYYALKKGIKLTPYQVNTALAIYKNGGYSPFALDPYSLLASLSGIVAQQQGDPFNDYLLLALYTHFQIGGGKPVIINAASLDFSSTSQEELGLTGMREEESRMVNLFNAGVSKNSLAFGKLIFTFEGNNQFSIAPNRFDFDVEMNNLFSMRNLGTILGAEISYNVYPMPGLGPLLPAMFGGPFPVIFKGNVTVPE